MASTPGITNSFKKEILEGTPHNLEATAGTYKMALYVNAATNTPNTAAYTVTNEVATAGGYSAGGADVATGTVILDSGNNSAFWTPGETTDGGNTQAGNITWSNVTFTTDNCLMYKNTTNETVAVFTFTSQAVSSGTFTLQMPVNNNANALIKLA